MTLPVLQTTSQFRQPDVSTIDDMGVRAPVDQHIRANSELNTKVYNDLKMMYNAMPQNAGVLYFGDSGTDGTWRIIISGNNLSFQRRESGSWVEKGGFTP